MRAGYKPRNSFSRRIPRRVRIFSAEKILKLRRRRAANPLLETRLAEFRGLRCYRRLKKHKNPTAFEAAVYKVVRKIPRGKTMTYGQVARLVGKPKASRAVGNALKKNFNPLTPCHRVIKSNGKLGFYNRGAKKKILLLKKEGAIFRF